MVIAIIMVITIKIYIYIYIYIYLTTFHHYKFRKKRIVITDHTSLVGINNKTPNKARRRLTNIIIN